jgi:hypothetical protein
MVMVTQTNQKIAAIVCILYQQFEQLQIYGVEYLIIVGSLMVFLPSEMTVI